MTPFSSPSALIGPDAPILLPPQSRQVEYEAELAVVIGRRCRNIRPEEAWTYLLGVTCTNDVTARDLQRRDGRRMRANCPVVPWPVVGVAEAEMADRAVICRVNGELRLSKGVRHAF